MDLDFELIRRGFEFHNEIMWLKPYWYFNKGECCIIVFRDYVDYGNYHVIAGRHNLYKKDYEFPTIEEAIYFIDSIKSDLLSDKFNPLKDFDIINKHEKIGDFDVTLDDNTLYVELSEGTLEYERCYAKLAANICEYLKKNDLNGANKCYIKAINNEK